MRRARRINWQATVCAMILLVLLWVSSANAVTQEWAIESFSTSAESISYGFVLQDYQLSPFGRCTDLLFGSKSTFNPLGNYVLLGGKWAVCGTVINNQFTQDPYATFKITAPGSGYIQWAANTPRNYVAPLVIGKVFEGSEPLSFESKLPVGIPTIYGNLLYKPFALIFVMPGELRAATHTFNVTYTGPTVPEPSSLLSLAAGLGLCLRFRRFRK